MIIDVEEDAVFLNVIDENLCEVYWVDYPLMVIFDSIGGDVIPHSWRSFRVEYEALVGVIPRGVNSALVSLREDDNG